MRTLIQSTTRYVSLIVVLITLVLLVMPGPVVAQDPRGEVETGWLASSFFRIASPEGKVALSNPWLGNPDRRTSLEQIDQADIILIPTGRRDEVCEPVGAIAAALSCSDQVLAISGCCKQRKSVNHAWRKNNLDFDGCQSKERGEILKPLGLFWWDISC
jgi:hypothetical protein